MIVLQVLTLPTRQDFPHQASYAAAGELVKAGVKIAFADRRHQRPPTAVSTPPKRSPGDSRATRRSRR